MKRTFIALIAAAAISIPAAALAQNTQNDPGNRSGSGARGQTMQDRGSHGDRTARNRGGHERGGFNGNFERRQHRWWNRSARNRYYRDHGRSGTYSR